MKELSERIHELLEKKHDLHKKGNYWYGLSCPFCGDSPNPDTYHLYIRLPEKDDKYVIKCFQNKCNVGGILNKEHLIKLGISDSRVYNNISEIASENLKYESYVLNGLELSYDVPNNVGAYFYNRTNQVLTDELIYDYRVVTDIDVFKRMNYNKIDTNAINKWLYNFGEGIGFLTKNGNQIMVRNFGDVRHSKLTLLSDVDSYMSKDWYEINYDFNPHQKGRNNIFFGEGVFDIINFIHLYNIPGLYIALGSFNAIYTIFPMVSKLFYDVNYNFIADADVSDNKYKFLLKKYDYRATGVNNIIRNIRSKDFGNVQEPIEMKIITI